MEKTMNKYKAKFEEKTVFNGYTDLCRYLNEDAHKVQSNSQKAQLDKWHRHFETEEIEIVGRKKKGIRITNIYEIPLPETIKRAIYAEDIKALILNWLANSSNNKIVISNKKKLETLGFVNADYNRISNLKDKNLRIYLSQKEITYATYEDFSTKNKDNFKDRFKVVFDNLIKSGLIYTPKKVYAIKYKNDANHYYTEETSREHEVIARCVQYTLKKYFNVIDFNAIRFSPKKVELYNKKSVEIVNKAFEKLKMREVEFFYLVTEVKGINKQDIIDACKIADVKTTLINLNQKIAENIINSAIEENAKEINKEYAEKLAEIKQLEEDDYDAYHDLCIEYYNETLDKYGNYATPETKYFFKGNRGSSTYVEETIKLVNFLIIKGEDEIESNINNITEGNY